MAQIYIAGVEYTGTSRKAQGKLAKKPVWIEEHKQVILHHLDASTLEELEKHLGDIKQHSGFGSLSVIMADGEISHYSVGMTFHHLDDFNEDMVVINPRPSKRRPKQTQKFLRLADGSQLTFQHLPFQYIKWLDERIGLLKNTNRGFGTLKAEVEHGGIREVHIEFTEHLPA